MSCLERNLLINFGMILKEKAMLKSKILKCSKGKICESWILLENIEHLR